ncbi:MAG TPA: hypothetical protein VGF71_00475 [Caulobacteraceae bacterium]
MPFSHVVEASLVRPRDFICCPKGERWARVRPTAAWWPASLDPQGEGNPEPAGVQRLNHRRD